MVTHDLAEGVVRQARQRDAARRFLEMHPGTVREDLHVDAGRIDVAQATRQIEMCLGDDAVVPA
jgi:hypothetical protein